jgi:peroxisomal 3,2-trans-enoyl-CoA isomerase
MSENVKVEYKGRIAVITIDNPQKLGALNNHGYYALSKSMREVAKHDEVFITVLTGTGKWSRNQCFKQLLTESRKLLLRVREHTLQAQHTSTPT